MASFPSFLFNTQRSACRAFHRTLLSLTHASQSTQVHFHTNIDIVFLDRQTCMASPVTAKTFFLNLWREIYSSRIVCLYQRMWIFLLYSTLCLCHIFNFYSDGLTLFIPREIKEGLADLQSICVLFGTDLFQSHQ